MVLRRILVVEDDKLFNETLEDFLEEEGFVVHCVLDPYSAIDLAYENIYDLYLFDVNLPYENGFSLLQKLRSSDDHTPCIFITSRQDKYSLKEGFEQGGDDYITKPVDLEELLLRIRAVLRRLIRNEVLKIGQYEFDIVTKKLSFENHPLVLSIKAGELLYVLLEGRGNIISFEYIKSRLWSTSEDASEGAIRVYVTQLKKYFPTEIQNVRGIGYKMSIK